VNNFVKTRSADFGFENNGSIVLKNRAIRPFPA